MELYTERHGIRAPQERTYSIDNNAYSVLIDCCEKYKKNLTHLFTLTCHDDFTDRDYIALNERGLVAKIRIKIPTLYMRGNNIFLCPASDEEYNQYALLDLIEYFAQNIQDISEHWNDNRYCNYKTIDCFNTKEVFVDFQREINEIFNEAGLLFELTDEQVIERIVENSPLATEIVNSIETIKEEGVKALLKDAVSLYKTPSDTARQDSVEKIWDAFERLKTYYTKMNKKDSTEKIIKDMAHGNDKFIELFNNEFLKLRDIGNQYRIRHHETNQIDIIDSRYYDYLFNRCLSLIALAIQYLD